MTEPIPTGWGKADPFALARLRRHRLETEARRLATAERCSPPEVAEILGIPEATVQRIVRAAA